MYINDAELAGTTRLYLIARFMLYLIARFMLYLIARFMLYLIARFMLYLIARFMLYPDSLYRGMTCTVNCLISATLNVSVFQIRTVSRQITFAISNFTTCTVLPRLSEHLWAERFYRLF